MPAPIFDPKSLQAVVQRTIAQSADIPAGARGVFLTVVTPEGLKALVAVRAGDRWTVQGSVDVARELNDFTFAVTVKGTF